MGREEELAFANELGRYHARTYGIPPITGAVLGWLMICDPPEQTAAELSEALGASRSAIGTAVAMLELQNQVQRTRAPGERAERIAMHPEIWVRNLDNPQDYIGIAEMARRGLEILGDAPTSRRARLLETAAFAEFLLERMPELAAEWRAHLQALRASGKLPEGGRS
jgi:hypothetical protein